MNAANVLPDAAPAPLAEAVAVVAERVGRPDLAGRLRRAAAGGGTHDVLVAGEYKAGKSSIVNAILNVSVCPTDVDEATAVPLVVADGPVADAYGSVEGHDGALERHPVPLERLAEALADPAGFAPGPMACAHVRLPRRFLEGGVRLVDTPGVGGLEAPGAAVVLAAAEAAAAVVFAVDGTRELTSTELGVLRRLTNACPCVVVVMTKIDLTPHWRTLAATLARRLTEAGLGDVPIVPASALLRHRALSRDDAALNDRSGYPRLVTRLRQCLAAGGATAGDGALSAATAAVMRQLDRWCREERALVDAPDDGVRARRLDDVAGARARVAALRAASTGWMQTLVDQGVALAADADHDLRTRVRLLTHEIEELVDRLDPGHDWDQIAHQVQQRIAEEVLAHRGFVQRLAAAVVAAVARHFLDQRAAAAPRFDTAAADALPDLSGPQITAMTIGGGALVAMKGSYGGVLMFGFASGLVGLSMVNPITAVAGIALGRKALADERKRQLALRRAQAKATLRKALDEVVHVESKRSRDAVRRLQQDLRKEFTAIADELSRTVEAALRDAQAALDADETARRERAARLDEARRELASLRAAAASARSDRP